MKKIIQLLGYIIYNMLIGWLPHYQLNLKWRIISFLREHICKWIFLYSGNNNDIGRKIKFSMNISIGDNSGIGDYAHFSGRVAIGSNVMIGPYCTFLAIDHKYEDTEEQIKNQGSYEEKIEIGDNVWIGAHVIILKGVIIGNGSVIGAGSVVTHDVPPNCVVAGNPAKIIKKRHASQSDFKNC